MKRIVRKICIFGDSSVGKTSLVTRFVEGEYDDKYKSTLGAVVKKKLIELPKNEIQFKFMIWDISGQSEFKRVHKSAFLNSKGGLAVCDLTRPKTIDSLLTWIENFRRYTNDEVPLLCLGNKSDLIKENSENIEHAKSIFKQKNYPYKITSAKEDYNVSESFQFLARSIVKNNGHDTKQKVMDHQDTLNTPNDIERPSEVLDYVIDTFAKMIGDYDLGMNLAQEKVDQNNIDFDDIDKMEMYSLIEDLVCIISNFKSEEAGIYMQDHLKNACNHCNEW